MLSADENENKPVGKPGQRKAKAEQLGKKAEPGKKGEPRKRKDDESHSAKPDRVPDAIEQASAPAEQISEPIAAAAAAPVMSTETSATPTKRSFQQTSSFVEQLAGARSLDRALELQTAFAREAYETFVSESKKIRKLHSELAKQRLERLEGFVTKMTQVALNPTRPR
jgi:cell division septation protein DedD